MLLLIALIHSTWGVLLWLSHGGGYYTTSGSLLAEFIPNAMTRGWIYIVAALLIIPYLFKPSRVRATCIFPQQVLLIFSGIGVLRAIVSGQYPDGTVPAHAARFITFDQLVYPLLCVFHFIEFWSEPFVTEPPLGRISVMGHNIRNLVQIFRSATEFTEFIIALILINRGWQVLTGQAMTAPALEGALTKGYLLIGVITIALLVLWPNRKVRAFFALLMAASFITMTVQIYRATHEFTASFPVLAFAASWCYIRLSSMQTVDDLILAQQHHEEQHGR